MARANDGFIDTAARFWSLGVVGVIAACLAVLTCYGLLALAALLPLVGMRLTLDQTVWAAAIAVFTLLTLLAILPGFLHHRSVFPAGTAIAGSGLILYALLVDYQAVVEFAGFALLIAAVSMDVVLRYRVFGAAGGTAGWRSGHNRNDDATQRPNGRQTS